MARGGAISGRLSVGRTKCVTDPVVGFVGKRPHLAFISPWLLRADLVSLPSRASPCAATRPASLTLVRLETHAARANLGAIPSPQAVACPSKYDKPPRPGSITLFPSASGAPASPDTTAGNCASRPRPSEAHESLHNDWSDGGSRSPDGRPRPDKRLDLSPL